jgi:NodT family efflux transporter outer membrane factor (OMF) lipoprotein
MLQTSAAGRGASALRRRHTLGALLAAAVIVLGGCRSVGPNYVRPPAETPMAWKEPPPEGWKSATPSDEIGKGNWWEIFGDPQLNDLEIQAIAANQNLKAAVQRVLAARASAKATRANLYPSVNFDPSVGRARSSGTRPISPGSVGATAYSANTISLPVDASYEVDLWGQIRRSVESGNALTQASVADYENVLLALKSDVAEYYVMVHYIDRQREILRNNIELQQKAFDLANVRHLGGAASGLDVSEAETLLNTTQGDYAGLGVQRAQFEHALAVLTGRPPAEFSAAEEALELQPPVIPAGLPSDLLERRPDIAAAERRMNANSALIGVARAAYFPNVALTGSGGLLSAALTQLFTVPSLVWTAAAIATQPLYAGGRLSAGVERANAVYEESVDIYRQQVLMAFQEVEDGLSGLRVLEEQAAAYDKAVQSAQRTVEISTSRYREGLAQYVEVITAETALLANERTAAQILEQRLLTTVQLIQALGGGWLDSRIYSSDLGLAATADLASGSSSPTAPATPTQRPQ